LMTAARTTVPSRRVARAIAGYDGCTWWMRKPCCTPPETMARAGGLAGAGCAGSAGLAMISFKTPTGPPGPGSAPGTQTTQATSIRPGSVAGSAVRSIFIGMWMGACSPSTSTVTIRRRGGVLPTGSGDFGGGAPGGTPTGVNTSRTRGNALVCHSGSTTVSTIRHDWQSQAMNVDQPRWARPADESRRDSENIVHLSPHRARRRCGGRRDALVSLLVMTPAREERFASSRAAIRQRTEGQKGHAGPQLYSHQRFS
jgi:hypothetical protein